MRQQARSVSPTSPAPRGPRAVRRPRSLGSHVDLRGRVRRAGTRCTGSRCPAAAAGRHRRSPPARRRSRAGRSSRRRTGCRTGSPPCRAASGRRAPRPSRRGRSPRRARPRDAGAGEDGHAARRRRSPRRARRPTRRPGRPGRRRGPATSMPPRRPPARRCRPAALITATPAAPNACWIAELITRGVCAAVRDHLAVVPSTRGTAGPGGSPGSTRADLRARDVAGDRQHRAPERCASYRPLMRCRLPGPHEPAQTASRPVSCASAPAAKAAASSWRTCTQSMPPSPAAVRRTASTTGLRLSPTIP